MLFDPACDCHDNIMSKKLFVLIGRMQPPTIGHESIWLYARDNLMHEGDKLLIISGSANESRTFRNPFTVEERHQMLKSVLDEDMKDFDYELDSINDSDNNYNAWIRDLKRIIKEHNHKNEYRPVIIGHDDIRTYARKAELPSHVIPVKIRTHGTRARLELLEGDFDKVRCPDPVKEWLKKHNAARLIQKICERELLREIAE